MLLGPLFVWTQAERDFVASTLALIAQKGLVDFFISASISSTGSFRYGLKSVDPSRVELILRTPVSYKT
jgi:hypothetical protein